MQLKNKTFLDTQSVLQENGINRTDFRTDLLNLFYSTNISLSVDDVMRYFDNSINKVTVYRSLKSFEDKGLIHKVPDVNNFKRYSLCIENECNTNSHNHNHGHFICYSCNQTFCLDEIKSTELICMKGFYIQELKLTAEGYCKNCYKA